MKLVFGLNYEEGYEGGELETAYGGYSDESCQ